MRSPSSPAAAALLAGAALVVHASGFRLASNELSPGPVGSGLLLLAGLAYLPNAVIWAMAYVIGPGFAFGVGTVVAPTGSVLGPLPLFPMLAALPSSPPVPHATGAGPVALSLLAIPYLAGAVGGVLTVRTAPSPSIEAAPLWGLAAGVLAGLATGALALVSGGPLGTGRLATVGPSAWQVALVAALEIGVASAITAGLANYVVIRRLRTRRPAPLIPAAADTPAPHHIYLNPWTPDGAEASAPTPAPNPASPFLAPQDPPPSPPSNPAPGLQSRGRARTRDVRRSRQSRVRVRAWVP